MKKGNSKFFLSLIRCSLFSSILPLIDIKARQFPRNVICRYEDVLLLLKSKLECICVVALLVGLGGLDDFIQSCFCYIGQVLFYS